MGEIEREENRCLFYQTSWYFEGNCLSFFRWMASGFFVFLPDSIREIRQRQSRDFICRQTLSVLAEQQQIQPGKNPAANRNTAKKRASARFFA